MEQFGVLTLGSRLKRLSDYLFSEVQALYRICDIPFSATYFPILRLLQENGAMSVVEIADRLKISHAAVSKQTVKMIKEDLLSKVGDTNDQRRSVLCLSPFGVSAMDRVEPILVEMKFILDQMTSGSSTNFMEALDLIDLQVTDSLANKILDRLTDIKIVPIQSNHKQAFYDLNMKWLKKYFPNQITEYDEAFLSDPQQHILDCDGWVWCAVRESKEGSSVIGTIALKSNGHLSYEISKLAVAEHCQGKGFSQSLLSKVIEFAKSKGAEKLTLETASCLDVAMHLYKKNGFIEMPFPESSRFDRADVYMEKILGDDK